MRVSGNLTCAAQHCICRAAGSHPAHTRIPYIADATTFESFREVILSAIHKLRMRVSATLA